MVYGLNHGLRAWKCVSEDRYLNETKQNFRIQGSSLNYKGLEYVHTECSNCFDGHDGLNFLCNLQPKTRISFLTIGSYQWSIYWEDKGKQSHRDHERGGGGWYSGWALRNLYFALHTDADTMTPMTHRKFDSHCQFLDSVLHRQSRRLLISLLFTMHLIYCWTNIKSRLILDISCLKTYR